MSTQTKGIIATAAAALLCGCPGLLLCLIGALAAPGSPVSTEWQGIRNTGPIEATTAFALLCVGLIFAVLPVAVGFLTLRKQPLPQGPSEETPPSA
jgi:hypothetical protein